MDVLYFSAFSPSKTIEIIIGFSLTIMFRLPSRNSIDIFEKKLVS